MFTSSNSTLTTAKPGEFDCKYMPPFELSMLNTLRENTSDEVAIEEETFGEWKYKISAYEKYRVIHMRYILDKQLLDEVSGKSVKKEKKLDTYLSLLDRGAFPIVRESGILKKLKLEALEKELGEDAFIKHLMENAYKKEGYVSIDTRIVSTNAQIMQKLKLAASLYIEELAKWIASHDVTKLTKASATKNLHTILQLLGVADESSILSAEYALYKNTWAFDSNFEYGQEYVNLDTIKSITNDKAPLEEHVEELEGVLFKSEPHNRPRQSTKRIGLCAYVKQLCFKKFKNEKALVNFLLPVVKDITLTPKDFSHVPQFEYVQSILVNGLVEKKKGVNILLYGKPGSGKTQLAKVLMKTTATNLYEIANTKQFTMGPKATIIQSSHSLERERDATSQLGNSIRVSNFLTMRALLKKANDAVILYDEAEDFFRKSNAVGQSKGAINDILENNTVPVLWTTNSIACLEESYLRRFTYVLNIDDLPEMVYNNILLKISKKYEIVLPESIVELYLYHKPNLGLVEKTLANYKLSNSSNIEMLKMDLEDSLKCQLNVTTLPAAPTNNFVFNPALLNTSEDLNGLVVNLKENKRLDFSLLLYGVPGASKTSFAKHIAKELGLKVLQKTYTDVSSCWVGETEKNIRELFAEARRNKSLIILDECDVLLQDRNMSNRSWEISQTEALLTEMEHHPYPFVMTTNLYKNLDAAVMRRILYKVKHDYLNSDQIIIAFKHFFNVDIKEKLNLSKLTSGDFAVVKKRAEFQNKLSDKEWLINSLTTEMNQKKLESGSEKIIL